MSSSEVTYRIAQLDDVEIVYEFELAKTSNDNTDEYEKMMSVWSSSFRKESLEHYFKLGWSFLDFDQDKKLVGFFLGQPLLFFSMQTQTLWIEHISAISAEISTELLDIAYKLAREKHFQRVLFTEETEKLNLQKEFPFKKWERTVQFLKTTK